jgi:hypothetical protein
MTPTTRHIQGQYRPIVKAAWQAHCTRLAVDPQDGAAYNDWYRAILLATCGISTTRAASLDQFDALIGAFRDLAVDAPAPEAAGIPEQPGFSDGQQRQFQKLVRKAWGIAKERGEIAGFAAWLAEILGHVDASASANRRFEDAMRLFAIVAGDEYWLDQTAKASEKRFRYLIGNALADLTELTGEPHDWRYVQGIHQQAKMSASLDDCPAYTLKTIFLMLDAYRRKLRGAPAKSASQADSVPF